MELNETPKTIKLLEENRNKSSLPWVRLDMTPKAKTTKEKTKLDFIKIK